MSAASDIRYNSELMQVKKQENGHCVFNLFIFNYRGERKKKPSQAAVITFIHFTCNLVLRASNKNHLGTSTTYL